MIRLRDSKGVATPVPNTVAVEYVTDDNRLAVVIIPEASGRTRILTPGDPLFNAYCNTNGMRPAHVSRVETSPVQG